MPPNSRDSYFTANSAADFDFSIGIVGTGTIGSMLVHCLSRAFPGRRLFVAGRDSSVLTRLVETSPEALAAPVAQIASKAHFIFLAIPPEAYASVLAEVRPLLQRETVLVSLTNAISLATIGTMVDNPVVKVIPTVAQEVGRGCTLVMAGPRASGQPVDSVVRLLTPFSKPLVIDERDSRAASNIAGSAIALFSEFANQLIAAHKGRQGGIDERRLTEMAGETMGAVGTLISSGYTFEQIIMKTAAPGGMTEAALSVIRDGCSEVVMTAVDKTYHLQKNLQESFM